MKWERKETVAAVLLGWMLICTTLLCIFWGWKRKVLGQELALPTPIGTCLLYLVYRMYVLGPNVFSILWLVSRALYFVADVLLSFSDDPAISSSFRDKLSQGGLIVFIIGHIIAVAALSVTPRAGATRPPALWLGLIPVVVCTAGLLLVLGFLSINAPPDAAALAVVGGVYTFFVCCVAWRAAAVLLATGPERILYARLLLAGALIFVVDDIVNFLGIAQFRILRWPMVVRTPVVIFPYTIAQFLLTYAVDVVGPKHGDPSRSRTNSSVAPAKLGTSNML